MLYFSKEEAFEITPVLRLTKYRSFELVEEERFEEDIYGLNEAIKQYLNEGHTFQKIFAAGDWLIIEFEESEDYLYER